ncbi:MAG: Transcriptional regulatory protein ZraR [Syntrophorhabdus sp. PtaU1.Bin153]|nr:MAG: Transcriptional regulatory protein ZraR [Syntrophorhabdus sp. PtaU1.Bin153]
MEKKAILIVDDDEMIRKFLTDFFVDLEYDVVTADNGEDALRKFVPQAFDLVISDLVMPDMNGIELLKELITRDKTVLFFLITGYPTLETAVEAIKSGAYDYIVKPFNLEDLRIKVERAMMTRHLKGSLRKVSGILWALIISVPIWIILGIILGFVWKRG